MTATTRSIDKETVKALIAEYGKGEGDSGSAEVQVAIVTALLGAPVLVVLVRRHRLAGL